jgi:L-asparagine transporter-like permease
MNNLNGFQSLSIVGLVFSVIVQITLLLIDKKVDTVWALYPTWIFVFIFGYLLKRFSKEEDHHHHH